MPVFSWCKYSSSSVSGIDIERRAVQSQHEEELGILWLKYIYVVCKSLSFNRQNTELKKEKENRKNTE